MDDFHIKIGPQGGEGGKDWDDSFHDGVREIFIWHGDSINAIQVVYDTNGQPFLGSKRGVDGINFTIVQLDYPDEYLTEVNGCMCANMDPWSLSDTTILKALKFSSNMTTYGPFGDKRRYVDPSYAGRSFCFTIPGNRIRGFLGRSDSRGLLALGVHVKAIRSSP